MRVRLIYILLIISFSCFATNYYISNTGDDGAAGTSTGTAWQTLSKIDDGSFSPGDSIFLEKGGLWRNTTKDMIGYGEIVSITESGTEGNPIYIGSYGNGARPKIFGSVARSSFTEISDNVYRMNDTVKYDPWYMPSNGQGTWLASIFFKMNDSTTWGDSCVQTGWGDMTKNYEWHYSNDTIYFYYDGTIGDIDSIEVCQNAVGIDIQGNWITIDGLEIRYFQHACIGNGDYPEEFKQGLVIQNCYLAYTSVRTGDVGYCISGYHSDALIYNNIIHDGGRRNISYNLYNQVEPGCTMRDVIFDKNFSFNGWHTTGIDLSTQGQFHTIRNIIVRNNTFYEDPTVDKSTFNLTMNFFENNGGWDDYDSIFVYNNEFMNPTLVAFSLIKGGHSWFVHNTLVAFPHSSAYSPVGFNIMDDSTHTTIMNNIICIYPNVYGYYAAIGAMLDRVHKWDTVDYNLVSIGYDGNDYIDHAPSDMAQSSYKQSEWSEIVSEGYETNSLVAPQWPHFADSLVDGSIRSTSPAIGAGTPISFVTTDILGTARDATNPTIGAYEMPYSSPTGTVNYLKHNGKYIKFNGKFIVQ